MILHPCPACRRHVGATESACPFCGGALASAPAAPSLTGRMSRAAVFASATLAGCWTQTAPQQTTPPDPVETNYAKPPDEASHAETRAETGTIEVTVADSSTGQAIPHYTVILSSAGGTAQQATAGANGIATFTKLAPGSYTATLPNNHPRRQPPRQVVTVAAGQVARTTLGVYVQQPHHQPMPYGAPPARRRIV